MSDRIELETPVPGTTVTVDRSGEPDGPTLVWLHSEFGALDGAPSRDLLGEQVDLIEVHLPGFGVSSGGDRFDGIADLASVVWWALEQLGVDRPAIAGHGLGATLAVEMSIQQPSMVRHLALAAPFGLFDPDDTGVDLFALMPRDLYPHLYANSTSGLISQHFPPPGDAYERGLAAIRRVEVLGSASRYLFPIPDTNVVARAYRLAGVPTTVWFGDSDGVVPVSLAAAWSAALPGADVRTVAGAAHMLPYEVDGFADELLAAIQGEVATA